MTKLSAVPAAIAADQAEPIQRIADFVRGYSLEVTRPSADDITALRETAKAGMRIFVSAVPGRPHAETVQAATRLHAAGFEPVPHIAVRNFASAAEFDRIIAQLAGEAGVRRVLVIAGDRGEPAGPFHDARDAIDSGLLQRRGIVEIAIAGYPEGHPRLSQHELDRALAQKIEIAEQVGLAVHIVTQFGFNAEAILAWIVRLRDFGIEHPVRIGLAGPTNMATLLRYAARCGVRASAQGLAHGAGLMKQFFGMSAPDGLVRALAQSRADGRLGRVAPHFFSFGGIAATARWASHVAEGRIALDPLDGFRLDPPRQKL